MGVAKYVKNEKDEIQDVILNLAFTSNLSIPKRFGRDRLRPGKDLALRRISFTRESPQGYRSREWTPANIQAWNPKETNERFKLMISHGQTVSM
jgi:methylmalonyl-CoA mutase N-terminal domain/subunit